MKCRWKSKLMMWISETRVINFFFQTITVLTECELKRKPQFKKLWNVSLLLSKMKSNLLLFLKIICSIIKTRMNEILATLKISFSILLIFFLEYLSLVLLYEYLSSAIDWENFYQKWEENITHKNSYGRIFF